MRTIEHFAYFTLPVPISELFPLFSPEGEMRWVPGWEYENIMGHKNLCEDYIFTTCNHDHASTQAVWLVKKYEPYRHYIQFYKVEAGDKVGVITVRCARLVDKQTKVEVRYRYTALSPAGEKFIAAFDKAAYASFIEEWRHLLCTHFGLG